MGFSSFMTSSGTGVETGVTTSCISRVGICWSGLVNCPTNVYYMIKHIHVKFITQHTTLDISTVKPVLRGHLWDKEKVVFYDRWPLKRGSIHMKFLWQDKTNVTF
jgi:hypothetical protein